MASIELSKNKDMSPYDQLLSLPSPSTLDPNMYYQQQQQDLSSPESGISSSQSSKDESTIAIGTANQLRDNIRVVAPPSTPVVSSSEDKIKNILSMFPYDRQSSQTNVRPPEFGSTIAPIGSIYSHNGSTSSTDEISLNRPPELGQLNIQPPRSPLQSSHYLPSQFTVSSPTTSPLLAKSSTQVQLASLPSVDEKQPQQHSGITEHRYQELLQSHQNFEQQTREMFEKMQNSLGKMMTFMESVDSRLSNLERLSSAILANQANRVTVVSSPLIPEPTTADFEAAKQMELFEQDRILAEKLQAEEKHEKEQEKGKKGKPDLPKKEKDFLPSSAALPASTPQVQVSSCPICNKQVISSELELHVNECLDADRKATATTPTPLPASTAQQEKDKSLWHKFWSPSTPVPTPIPTPTPPTPAPQPQPQSQSQPQPQASHSLYPSSSLPQRLPAPVASTTISNSSSAATNYPPPPPYAIPQQPSPYYSQPVYRQTGYPPYPYSQYPGNMMQPMMPMPPNGTAQNGPYLYYATQQPVSQPNNSLQQPKN